MALDKGATAKPFSLRHHSLSHGGEMKIYMMLSAPHPGHAGMVELFRRVWKTCEPEVVGPKGRHVFCPLPVVGRIGFFSPLLSWRLLPSKLIQQKDMKSVCVLAA
jgi:hypothetical protein